MKVDNFEPCNLTGAGGSASPSGTTATITPTFTNPNGLAMSILLTNLGTDTILVAFGDSTVTASVTPMPILPNDKQIFNWNAGQSFAHKGVTGSGSTLYWNIGYGT